MDWYVRAFLRSAVVWLAAGVTLGLAMAAHPPLIALRTAHIHMNLLGFVAMMIFGVGYHVFPRFAGVPLHRPALATAHWWLANVGLLLLAAGFAARHAAPAPWVRPALIAGGLLSAAGAYAYAWNVWHTIGAAPAPTRRPRGPSLPLAAGG